MAHHPDEGDIFIIQQQLKWTQSTLGILHQAFDDYAFGLLLSSEAGIIRFKDDSKTYPMLNRSIALHDAEK